MGVLDRVSKAWNTFRANDEISEYSNYDSTRYGESFGSRPDRTRSTFFNDRTIIAGIHTQISMDAASVNVQHVRQDKNKRYVEEIPSHLNECLTVEANLDQAATAFRQDMVQTLLEKGTIAIVPVDTDKQPDNLGNYDIYTLRVGEIISWYPAHVKVKVYNEKTGKRQEIILSKTKVAVVENPLYSVMNEPNSLLQRLIRKLQLLDSVDEAASSGKLDLIIQLPYTIKSQLRREQADTRRRQIEEQLVGSKYGIAYADGTEKITQLNRPAENNMLKQIEYLMGQLYGQLGLTQAIFDGTADEAAMLNYQNRTIVPILTAITESMARTFLTKTARTQGQSIAYLRDPFKLVPISQLADIADKMTRNEILSSNEFRGVMGFKPSDDPKADRLVNANMPQSDPLEDEQY